MLFNKTSRKTAIRMGMTVIFLGENIVKAMIVILELNPRTRATSCAQYVQNLLGCQQHEYTKTIINTEAFDCSLNWQSIRKRN